MRKLYVAMDETDHSLRGLALGQTLSAQWEVPLSVVSVVPETGRVTSRRGALEARLDAAGVSVPVEVVADASAKEYLAALAGQQGVGLCMGAHGRRPIPEILIGSVTAGVVRRSPRPVFLCGPRFCPEAHRRVEVLMVCVDGSPLSEAMLPHAVAMADCLEARLQLLQVVEVGGGAGGDTAESGYVHSLARRLHHDYRRYVDWEVLHGDPADAIVGYLEECQNVMLAMTTHGRSGLSQVVAGSVSHEVLHEAPCPVAVWRPQAA